MANTSDRPAHGAAGLAHAADAPSDTRRSEPVRRLADIEEISNLRLIHPIANRLTPILRDLHVSPNAVSLAGMALGIMAGIAYFHGQDRRWALAGFCLMIGWHVMDGADGQLARLTNRQSELGRILDGVCDYVTFISVYAGLALASSPRHGAAVWLVVLLSGICHAVQSAAYEAQRQEYEFWACGRTSKNILGAEAGAAPRHGRIAIWLDRFYATIQFAAIGSTIAFHRRLAADLRHGADAASLRAHYAAAFARPVRRWSILSANDRTLGIFICVLCGYPLAYFGFEIVGFSLILALLTAQLRPVRAAFRRAAGLPP